MKLLPIILIVLFSSIVACCRGHKYGGQFEKVRDTISTMQTHPVKVSLHKMSCCVPNNNADKGNDGIKDYRLVVYVDSSMCSPCIIDRMFLWNDMIGMTRNKVKYIFIFEPKKSQLEEAKLSVESSGLKANIYLDTASVFRNENTFIPKEDKYHSMLINSKDSIVMVGMPLTNDKIKNIYYKILGVKTKN